MARELFTRSIAYLLPPLFAFAFFAATAFAASDEENKNYDARLEHYTSSVQLDAGGNALTWFLVIILSILCIGVLFKNANRSHLD